MRRTKLVLAAAAVMVVLLVAFAAPAMANNNFHNGFFGHNGVFQSNEQQAESGDSSPDVQCHRWWR